MSCPNCCSSQIRGMSSLCTSLTPHAGPLSSSSPWGPQQPRRKAGGKDGREREVLAPFKALLQCMKSVHVRVWALKFSRRCKTEAVRKDEDLYVVIKVFQQLTLKYLQRSYLPCTAVWGAAKSLVRVLHERGGCLGISPPGRGPAGMESPPADSAFLVPFILDFGDDVMTPFKNNLFRHVCFRG